MANLAPAAATPGLLAGVAPAGAAARNPMWNGMQQAPLMGAFAPYNQMAAFAAAQENALPMVSIAKLASASNKTKASTNSTLVVRGSLRRMNGLGGTLSVAEWTRKTLEENLEWLVKLAKRHAPTEKAIFFTYGDGCETLLLLDAQVNKIPGDLKKIKKIAVGCTMAEIEKSLDEDKLAKHGILQPKDSIWEHLRFETIGARQTPGNDKPAKGIFIHTKTSVLGESFDGRRRVLQATTGSNLGYKPNADFEQQVLNKWRQTFPSPFPPVAGLAMPMNGMMGMPMILPNTVAMGAATMASADAPTERETVITFNPKELLLLEKAFDNRLTERDSKSAAVKYTAQDKIACQAVIRRAQNEFVMRGPSRKRKPKGEKAKEGSPSKKAKKDAPVVGKKESPKKATKSSASTKPEVPKKQSKSTPTKKKKGGDDDDEPISKMVSAKKTGRISLTKPKSPKSTKSKAVPKKAASKGTPKKPAPKTTPKKSASKGTPKKPEPKTTPKKKAETPKKEVTRGRPKGSSKKKEAMSPKKRSSSRSKK